MNGRTDSNTSLFSVSCLFLLLCFGIICRRKCVSVRTCVCVAVNSYGCYIWIVNDLIHCNPFILFIL